MVILLLRQYDNGRRGLLGVTQVVSHHSCDALRAVHRSSSEFPYQGYDKYFPSTTLFLRQCGNERWGLLGVTQEVSHHSIEALRAVLQSPIEFPHQVSDEYFPSPHCCLDSMAMGDEAIWFYPNSISSLFWWPDIKRVSSSEIDKYFSSPHCWLDSMAMGDEACLVLPK
jgi:hypothetical protein